MNGAEIEFGEAIQRLLRDVEDTVGPGHASVMLELASRGRELDWTDVVDQCVAEVQQYLHDTFVDTTWPACPKHPNHPLWYYDSAGRCPDSAWRCPLDGAAIAELGELSTRDKTHG